MIANLIAGVMGLHRAGAAAPWLATALAVPWVWGLHLLGGFPLVVAATLIGAAKVVWAAHLADVPMIADRMIGVFLALWPLSGGLWHAGVAAHIFPWPGWVGAFVMFNLIVRLPFIRRLGARHALADDLAAGAVAALIVTGAAAISHGWMG